METAVYWCGQAANLSHGDDQDMYRWAESMIRARQYHRAAHLLKEANLESKSWQGCFLASNACYLAGNIEDACKLLEANEELIEKKHSDDALKEDQSKKVWLVALLVLKGKILEAMDNRTQASEIFREALKLDPYCQEALSYLTKHQMLSADKEQALLESIPFEDNEEKELIYFLYSIGLKKYDKPQDLKIPKGLENDLSDNLAVQVAIAERHFYNCDYPASHRLSSVVMKKDPFHEICLPIHVSCLVELRKPNGKLVCH